MLLIVMAHCIYFFRYSAFDNAVVVEIGMEYIYLGTLITKLTYWLEDRYCEFLHLYIGSNMGYRLAIRLDLHRTVLNELQKCPKWELLTQVASVISHLQHRIEIFSKKP